MSAMSDARKKLRDAGVAEAQIAAMLINDDMAESINNYTPDELAGLAMANPAASASEWMQARSTYGFGARPSMLRPVLGSRPIGSFAGIEIPRIKFEDTGKPYIVSESGAIQYRNGVIADPNTGALFYPPNENVAGSSVWLREVQENWSQDKINTWRKRLIDNGYGEQFSIAAKGGVDQQFLTALAEYHKSKYLNFGKPVPLTTLGGEREKMSDVISRPEIREEVRAWFREGFGDDPSDDEMEWAVKGMQRIFRKQLKAGREPERAAGIAGARMQEKFFESPQVKYLRDSDEENTELRDSMISFGQVVDSL